MSQVTVSSLNQKHHSHYKHLNLQCLCHKYLLYLRWRRLSQNPKYQQLQWPSPAVLEIKVQVVYQVFYVISFHDNNVLHVILQNIHCSQMVGVRHYLKLTTSGYLRHYLQQMRKEKQSWTLAGEQHISCRSFKFAVFDITFSIVYYFRSCVFFWITEGYVNYYFF